MKMERRWAEMKTQNQMCKPNWNDNGIEEGGGKLGRKTRKQEVTG